MRSGKELWTQIFALEEDKVEVRHGTMDADGRMVAVEEDEVEVWQRTGNIGRRWSQYRRTRRRIDVKSYNPHLTGKKMYCT